MPYVILSPTQATRTTPSGTSRIAPDVVQLVPLHRAEATHRTSNVFLIRKIHPHW